MGKKLTQEEFIKRINEKYGKKFNHNKVIYESGRKEIIIICNTCNKDFLRMARNHIYSKNQGCPHCAGRMMNTQIFIDAAKKIHKKKYNYEKVIYKNADTFIKIKCNNCNVIFECSPTVHLRNSNGAHCKNCLFIEKAKKIHKKGAFDYSKTIYVKAIEKVIIICNNCNQEFRQRPNDHISNKSRCSHCFGTTKMTKSSFIKRALEIHEEGLFNYDNIKYVNLKTKIDIFCNKCNKAFSQNPSSHIHNKYGCPKCKSSFGEKNIRRYLHENNIDYEEQVYKNYLGKQYIYDFYIPHLKLFIEYNGIQHYKYVHFFHRTQKYFQYRELKDVMKKKYCIRKKYNLLIISYKERNTIKKELKKELKKINKKKTGIFYTNKKLK